MHFRAKFQKLLKGPSFHCQKLVELLFKKGWFFHKIFDNSHLKFGKMKKAKIKKQHV